jgi:hypothetical protein
MRDDRLVSVPQSRRLEMRATSIQLYSRQSYDDSGQPAYCGCYYVPCPDGDLRISDLGCLNLGRAREEDGTITRSFFFADEIDAMIEQAERVTGCIAETPWEYAEVAAMRER